jgi:hypothetical protein
MGLERVEPHPRRVLDAFRQGDCDGLEILGQADEKAFFELCIREELLEGLAASMPTARQKEEVPNWFVLAANLSLKLHGEQAFYVFERVVRCGGLLSALDPAIASEHLDRQQGQVARQCLGFNDKNQYDGPTPWDQDMLRKFVKDVQADRWLGWFNGPGQTTFQQYGFFDPEGVFVGDASYLFVADNPAYEGSVVLWFGAYNHPVTYAELTAEQRKKAHRERCYKLVSLLHLRGANCVYGAAAVVAGNLHALPILYALGEQFVRRVGLGVMKRLILDRGFIDGVRIAYCKTILGVDVLIPLKKNMDIGKDAWQLAEHFPWQPWVEPPRRCPRRPHGPPSSSSAKPNPRTSRRRIAGALGPRFNPPALHSLSRT